MSTLKQLVNVMVPVRDQDAAIAFYTEKVGFEKRVDIPFGDGDEAGRLAGRERLGVCLRDAPGPDDPEFKFIAQVGVLTVLRAQRDSRRAASRTASAM